jgi:PAS domain S-box-containing protein
MEVHVNVYSALVLLSAITSFSLGIVAWRNRRNRLTNAVFAVLMVSIGCWALTNFLEHLFISFPAKVFISNVTYFSIVFTVATWLIFALAYSGRSHLLTRRNLFLLSIEPILLLLLVWTNPWHHLIRASLSLDSSGSFPILVADYGVGFWIHTVYSYLILLIGTILLIQHTAQAPDVYRKQAILLICSMLIPWILNAVYLLGLTRYGLTSAGFTVAGIGIAWGLLHLRFLDVAPMARTAVFASLNDAVMTLDEQDRVIDLNPAAEKLLVTSQSEAIGQKIENLLAFQPELIETYGQVEKVHTELAFTQNDPPAYYDLRISPVYNRRQNLIARVVVIRDITARKLAEKAEQEERQLAEALRDVAVALNSTLDPGEIFTRILENVERVLPHDSANIMLNDAGTAYIVDVRGGPNKKVHESIWQRRFMVTEVATLRKMVETKQPVILPDVETDPDWRSYPDLEWIRSYIGVPILQDEEVIGFINLDSSIPGAFKPEHSKPLQAFADQVGVALKNAHLYRALEERNQELDAYAYTIAHDLNSPLALIKGYAGLLAELDGLPDEGQKYLTKISETSDRMTEMIDQLLLLAKLRDVEATAVSVDLHPLILSVKSRFDEQIKQRQIQVDIQEEWPPVLGQPIWIEEVIINLVSNAIKYIGHHNNSPKIIIRSEDYDEQIRVYVEDNGLGIHINDQHDLFEMFTRYHKEEASGTGLGLPIVQRIVTKLGGEVGVESCQGQGSSFWFTLPVG